MKLPSDLFLKIIKIGHDTSMRGEGISLHDALKRIDYAGIQKDFESEDLMPLIKSNPSLINEWILYSEDKRTDGGFYLMEKSIGSCKSLNTVYKSESQFELVSKYIVMELDFWAKLQ